MSEILDFVAPVAEDNNGDNEMEEPQGLGEEDNDDGEEHDEEEAYLPTPLRRTFMAIEQLTWSVIAFAIEARLRTTTSDSVTLRKYLQIFVPWVSVLSIASLSRKYVLRGLDKGVLYKIHFYYYFEEQGRRIWHSVHLAEAFVFLFAVGHIVTTNYAWLKSVNDWKSNQPYKSIPMAFAAMVLVMMIGDVIINYTLGY